MSQREVKIVGGPYGTAAKVTGQEELVVSVANASIPVVILPTTTAITTPLISRVSTSGNSINNVFSVTFKNVGAANGTVMLETLKPNESISWIAPAGTKLDNINYDASGTEFLVTAVY
jgi:hypothetical protein